jgi:hypothetical protein
MKSFLPSPAWGLLDTNSFLENMSDKMTIVCYHEVAKTEAFHPEHLILVNTHIQYTHIHKSEKNDLS